MQELISIKEKKEKNHNFKSRILELFLERNGLFLDFEEVLKNKNRAPEFLTVVLEGKNYHTAIEMNTLKPKIFIYDDFNNKHYIKNKKNFIKEFEEFVNKNKFKVSDTKRSIYLVTDGTFTKIGATSYNVKKRLFELQTGNAKELKIIYEYKVKNKFSTEKLLHDMFSEKKILGEWFCLTFEDIQKIISNKFNAEQNKCNLGKYLIETLENDIKILETIQSNYISKVYRRYINKQNNRLNIQKNKMNSKERFYVNMILSNSSNESFIYSLLVGK